MIAMLVWGLVSLVFGLLQGSILPGDGHVAIQLLHILAGMIGIGMTEALAGKLTRANA